MSNQPKVIRTFKTFHLLSAAVEGEAGKVELTTQAIKEFQEIASSSLHIIGLIGSKSAIKQTIATMDKHIHADEEGIERTQYDLDLSREPNERAVVYLIPLESSQLKGKCYCIAALPILNDINNEELDFKSAHCLLVRFLADMCNTLVLTYNEQMERTFELAGCTYIPEKLIYQLKLTNRLRENITFRETSFRQEKLVSFKHNYSEGMSFQTPDRNNFLTHVTKELYQDTRKQRVLRAITACWEMLFVRTDTDLDRLLNSMSIESNTANKQMIQRLVKLEFELYKKAKEAAKSCLTEVNSYYQRDRGFVGSIFGLFRTESLPFDAFADKVCAITIQHTVIKPDDGCLQRTNSETFERDLTMAIGQAIDQDGIKQYSFYKPLFEQSVKKLVETTSRLIASAARDLLKELNKPLEDEFQTNQEIIEVTLLGIDITRNQQGRVQQVTTSQTEHLTFRERKCSIQLHVSSLSQIKDIRVLDLPGEPTGRLLWMELKKNSKSNTAQLLILRGEVAKLLKKFQEEDVKFFFSPSNNKGYYVFFEQRIGKISHFTIRNQSIQDKTIATFSRTARGIISVGISIRPERLFYLTKERDVLYSYGIIDGRELEICHNIVTQGQPQKCLRQGDARPYDYVKCFNEDAYVVLGNNQQMHIVEWDARGTPTIKYEVRLQRTFLGINILNDNRNGYVLIHDVAQSKTLILENLSTNTLVSCDRQPIRQLKGNPIINVFKEACDQYSDYGTLSYRNRKRLLVHLTSIPTEKLLNDIGQSGMAGYHHKVLTTEEVAQLLDYTTLVHTAELLHSLRSQIPLQICGLYQDNLKLVSLGQGSGNLMNMELAIAKRCEFLNFGMLEALPITDLPTVVVGVIGSQNAEKASLLNNLFGTRFTEPSSTAREGLWISLRQTSTMNILIIDCQVLPSSNISKQLQSKLFHAVASLADFTIVTEKVLSSIFKLLGNTNHHLLNSDILYKGQLVAVIQDVPTTDSPNIQAKFEELLRAQLDQSNVLSGLNVFNNQISIVTLNDFRVKSEFKNGLLQLRRYITAESMKKPKRTFEDVLVQLKIVLIQLSNNDRGRFEEHFTEYRFESIRKSAMEVWMKGSQERKTVMKTINGEELSILEDELVLVDHTTQTSDLAVLLHQLATVLPPSKLSSSEFNQTHRELNDFIRDLFGMRKVAAEEVIDQQLKKQSSAINLEHQHEFKTQIKVELNKRLECLRLCLLECYKCKLLCTAPTGHHRQETISKEKSLLQERVRREEEIEALLSQHSEQQLELIDFGIDKKKADYSKQRESIEAQMGFVQQQGNVEGSLRANKTQIENAEQEIERLQKRHSTKNLESLKQMIEKFTVNTKQLKRQVHGNHLEIQLALDTRVEDVRECQNEEQVQRLKTKLESQFDSIRQLQHILREKSKECQTMQEKYKLDSHKIEGEAESLKSKFRNLERQVEVDEHSRDRINQQLKKSKEQLSASQIKLQELKKEMQDVLVFKQDARVIQRNIVLGSQPLEELAREVSAIEDDLKGLRFNPTFQTALSSIMDRIVSVERQLRKAKAQRQSSYAAFVEYERALGAELNVPTQDILSDIQQKIKVWDKKLTTCSNKDQSENYQQRKRKREEQLLTYTTKSAVLKNLQQSEHFLSSQRETMVEELKSYGGREFTSVLVAVTNYLAVTSCQQSQEVAKGFTKEYPAYSEYKQELAQVRLSQLPSLRCQLVQHLHAFDECVNNEKQENFQQSLRNIEKATSVVQVKIKFCEFWLSQMKDSKSLFQLAREAIEGDSQPLRKGTFSSEGSMKGEILEVDRRGTDEPNPERRILTKVKELTLQKYSLFVKESLEQHPQQIEIEVDIQKELINIKGVNGEQLKTSTVQNFFDFLKGVPIVMKSALSTIQPCFREVVHYYPESYETVIDALEVLMRELQISVAKQLCVKVKEVHKDNLNNLPTQLFKLVFDEMRLYFKEEKQRLEKQLYEKRETISQEKIRAANEQFLKTKIAYQQERQSMIIQSIDRLEIERRGLEGQIHNQTAQLEHTKGQIELKKKTMTSLTEEYLRINTEGKQPIEQSLQRLTNERQLYLKLVQLISFDEGQFSVVLKNWEGEQLSNIESTRRIQSLEGKITELKLLVASMNDSLQQLPNMLNVQTLSSLTTKMQQNHRKQLELEALKYKLMGVEEQRYKVKSLKKQLRSLDNFNGQLCSCFTSHLCSESCYYKCEGRNCNKFAGHEGAHLCSTAMHKCTSQCKHPGCASTCNEELSHQQTIEHLCNNHRYCGEKCKYCPSMCCKLNNQDHDVHRCNSTEGCMYQCIFCNRPCASPRHDHDEDAEIVSIRKDGAIVKMKQHQCSNEHSCPQDCSQQGICVYLYENNMVNCNISGTSYCEVQQIPAKGKCRKKIGPGQTKHEGSCDCGRLHSCNERCPNCKKLCELKFQHADGKHTTQHTTYNIAEKSFLEKESEDGLSESPAFQLVSCYDDCKRKGRGHYHIKECKGGSDCGEVVYKQSGTVRHSDKRSPSHPDKLYDMFLCGQYWESCGFQMPNRHLAYEYYSCNFFCTRQHKSRVPRQYCQRRAWHTKEMRNEYHQFDCDAEHEDHKKVEVCFLVDATGAMNKWVQHCATAVGSISEAVRKMCPSSPIKFAVVAYRDHPMSLSKMVIELRDLALKKQKELEKLAPPSHAEIQLTETEYIKRLVNLQTQWFSIGTEQFLKKLGEVDKFIVKYHYPFVVEVRSREDMVSVEQRLKSEPVIQLIQMFGGGDSKEKLPLKTYLLNDIKQSISDLENHISREVELITKLEFTEDQAAMKFLKAIDCSGGGDESEAVFDGMNEILKLQWSQGSVRMVFHLFDQPPHGKEYREGDDFFPDGCPCGLTQKKVIEGVNRLKAKYVMFTLNRNVNKAIDLFRQDGLEMETKAIEEPKEIVTRAVEATVELIERMR